MTHESGATEFATASLRHGVAAVIEAFDHVSDTYVFAKNERREFVACSQPFVELMGRHSKADILGKRDEDFSPEYLVEHYRTYDEAVLTTGEPLVELVELVRNQDGTYDWFMSSKTAIRSENGVVAGILGITRALSSRPAVTESLMNLTPAVEHMAREYAKPLRIEDLAQIATLSTSQFNRVFKRHFGLTPYQYLSRIRLMAVCDLLATTRLTVREIAMRTGFYDTSHLTNEMRKARGMTPSTYRNMFQNTHPTRRDRQTLATASTDWEFWKWDSLPAPDIENAAARAASQGERQ